MARMKLKKANCVGCGTKARKKTSRYCSGCGTPSTNNPRVVDTARKATMKATAPTRTVTKSVAPLNPLWSPMLRDADPAVRELAYAQVYGPLLAKGR